MKKIKLIKIDSEIGAGTRGSSLGNKALEIAALNLNDSYFNDHESITLEHENHLLYDEINTPNAIRIEGITRVYERLSDAVCNTIQEGTHFPLVLAGDHSSIGGSIAGVKKAFPDKKLGVIWVDAHGDLHSPYTTPTGNVHGMPLATALAEDNVDNQINDPNKQTREMWDLLKGMGGVQPKVVPEDLIFFGVRDVEAPEVNLMERLSIKNYTVEEVRKMGVSSSVDSALRRLEDCDLIYLSFDVDSMDCDLISKGTGTPVENGFSAEEAQNILIQLIESGKVCCFDMVEVNPTLDNKINKMADTAFTILKAVTKAIQS